MVAEEFTKFHSGLKRGDVVGVVGFPGLDSLDPVSLWQIFSVVVLVLVLKNKLCIVDTKHFLVFTCIQVSGFCYSFLLRILLSALQRSQATENDTTYL